MENEKSLVAFEKYKIRRFYDEKNETWYFSVVDVVGALTHSTNPRDYWFKMKIRVKTEDGFELSTICRQLKMGSSDGKKYATDCAKDLRDVQKAPVKTGMKLEVRLLSQVLYGVRISHPLRPRAMPRRPVMAWGSVSRDVHRRSIELRNHRSGVPTLLDEGEGNMNECDMRAVIRLPGVRDLGHVHTLHEREPGDLGTLKKGQTCS